MFPDGEMVRDLQTELDGMIEAGVAQITRLLKNSDTRTSNTAADTEENFIMDQRKRHSYRGINIYRQCYAYYQCHHYKGILLHCYRIYIHSIIIKVLRHHNEFKIRL